MNPRSKQAFRYRAFPAWDTTLAAPEDAHQAIRAKDQQAVGTELWNKPQNPASAQHCDAKMILV